MFTAASSSFLDVVPVQKVLESLDLVSITENRNARKGGEMGCEKQNARLIFRKAQGE